MAGSFDEALEAAWGRFEERLLAHLVWLEDGEPVVLVQHATGEGARYVQFVARQGTLHAEVSGNRSLDEAWRLSRVDHRKLRALGWAPPRAGRPNWWVEVTAEEVPVAVTMAVGALRHVLGVVSPDFLDGLSDLEPSPVVVPEHDDSAHEDEHGTFQVGWPREPDELGRMISRFLVEHRGVDPDEALPDDDGDYHLADGRAWLWLRPRRESAGLTIFTTLVSGVEDLGAALVEANVLNRRVPWCRFSCEGSAIVLYSEVPANPLAAYQLDERLDHVLALLADIGADVHERLSAPARLRETYRKDIA